MTDGQTVVLAVAIAVAALVAAPVPWSAPIAAAIAAAFVGALGVDARVRAALVVLAVALVASAASWRAWHAFSPSVAGPWGGAVRLATDPEPVAGGVRVRLDTGDPAIGIVDARAWGGPAGQLRNRLMGEIVEVRITTRSITEPTTWQRSHNISGRATVVEVNGWRTGGAFTRVANSIRRTIESGATVMTRDQRSLLTGLVYGDDRHQNAVTADDFRAAGLTHLLAVSGQNVAFALVVFGPLIRRVGYRSRFGLVVLVLVGFATLTRFEPSVLRACTMAGVAAFTVVIGRPASGVRVLALAVAVLLLVDPLLVHSVAFQLSVAASAGILVLSPRLVPLIRGPRILAEALAVTAGAQLSVAPLIIARFESLPVASLPANLLAGPAAGPVMMWGVTAGWIAGLVGERAASLLHAPTRLLLDWIARVAELCGALPLGHLGWGSLATLVAAVAFVLRSPTPARRRVASAVGAVVLVAAASLHMSAPRTPISVDGSIVWRSASVDVLMLDPGTEVDDLLASLRRGGVRSLDLVIAERGGWATHAVVESLRDRWRVDAVWAPDDHGLSGAVAIRAATQLTVGPYHLHIEPVMAGERPTLHTRVTPVVGARG